MPTKVAIIGAGGMLQYHAAGFKESGAEIVSLVDMNEDAAKEAAKTWGISETYTDVAEMLEKSDVDAVRVMLPHKFTAPMSISCITAWKYAFAEKPHA